MTRRPFREPAAAAAGALAAMWPSLLVSHAAGTPQALN